MEKIILFPRAVIIFSLSLTISSAVFAQVGIGNTNPSPSSLLDVRDGNNDKGILIPKVDIPNLANANPVTTATAADEGLLVYNTNTTTGPGYFYWNGTRWMPIDSGKNWYLGGNSGTVAGTHFLGTIDNQDLRIRTNNNDRFDFTANGRFRSYNDGTALEPTYSWYPDVGTGLFRAASNTLAFSTSGAERMRISADGNVQVGTGTSATERLQVNGNLRLNGAFMPDNQAGTSGRVLTSTGSDTAPAWGAEIINVNNIQTFLTTAMTLDSWTTYVVTFPVPGMTNEGTAIVNLSGDWMTSLSDNVTIHHVEARTGEIRFIISNNNSFTSYIGVDFTITIIR